MGGLGSDLLVNKTQELPMMGYNENLRGALLCLYSLTCGKTGCRQLSISRFFQSPGITEQENRGIPGCLLAGQGKAIPTGHSSNGTERKQSPKGRVFQDMAEERRGRDFLVQYLSRGTSAGSHWNRFGRENIPLFLTSSSI